MDTYKNKKIHLILTTAVLISIISFSISYAMEGYFRPQSSEINDIVLGTEFVSMTDGDSLNAYDSSGKLLPGFPVFVDNSIFVTSPLLVDIHGDGIKDIAIVARDTNNIFTVYVYDGTGVLMSQDVLEDKSVYYDLALLKSESQNKKNFVLITEDGKVLEYSLVNGVLEEQEIISINSVGSIATNNARNKIYIAPLSSNSIDIYTKENNIWEKTDSINTEEPIIYPVLESKIGDIFAINYLGELVSYNVSDGQLRTGFPISFDSMPATSPIISEQDSENLGEELVVLLSNGKSILLRTDGLILNNNFGENSFLSTNIKIMGMSHDEIPPQQISGLSAEIVENGIFLNWNPYKNIDNDFSYFKIYRNTTTTISIGDLEFLAHVENVSTTSYLDENVVSGEYYYTITVVDYSGNESEPTGWIGPIEWFVDADTDGDGVSDGVDNCLSVLNPTQSDFDSDGKGDMCDLPRGDLNFDNDINIVDVQCMILLALLEMTGEPFEIPECLTSQQMDDADINCDGSVDVVDVEAVKIISLHNMTCKIETGLCDPVFVEDHDADHNNIFDVCEL